MNCIGQRLVANDVLVFKNLFLQIMGTWSGSESLSGFLVKCVTQWIRGLGFNIDKVLVSAM